MRFEISVVGNTPLTPLDDLDEVATAFLESIGYLPKGYDPKTGGKGVKASVPYRLFVECFLKRGERGWTAEELAAKLNTSKPTVYRHINKLKAMDLLDEVSVDVSGVPHKGYRMRYGTLSKAWNFVEAHVEVAMENYRKTVDHLEKLSREK
jgi:predicted transcriptional regulator